MIPNYLKLDSDDDISLLWLSTTGTACLCIYYWKFPAMIHSLVEKEVSKGIPSSRIVLSGFSQVGAVFSLVYFLKFFPLIIMIECCHQNFNRQHPLIPSSAPFFQILIFAFAGRGLSSLCLSHVPSQAGWCGLPLWLASRSMGVCERGILLIISNKYFWIIEVRHNYYWCGMHLAPLEFVSVIHLIHL